MMHKHVLKVLLLTLGAFLTTSSFAQSEPAMMEKRQAGQSLADPIPHNLCQPDGVAIGGYDLVSYRQENGPTMGSEAYQTDHNGLQYWFIDEANRTAFLDNPDRFKPAYDGFCAITLALGRVTCPQYENFKIENDRLLLFEVTGFTNGRTLWNSDPEDFRGKADKNFSQISQ